MDFSVPIHQRRYEMLFVCLVFDVLFLTETASRTQFNCFRKCANTYLFNAKTQKKIIVVLTLTLLFTLFRNKLKQKPFNLERSVFLFEYEYF